MLIILTITINAMLLFMIINIILNLYSIIRYNSIIHYMHYLWYSNHYFNIKIAFFIVFISSVIATLLNFLYPQIVLKYLKNIFDDLYTILPQNFDATKNLDNTNNTAKRSYYLESLNNMLLQSIHYIKQNYLKNFTNNYATYKINSINIIVNNNPDNTLVFQHYINNSIIINPNLFSTRTLHELNTMLTNEVYALFCYFDLFLFVFYASNIVLITTSYVINTYYNCSKNILSYIRQYNRHTAIVVLLINCACFLILLPIMLSIIIARYMVYSVSYISRL